MLTNLSLTDSILQIYYIRHDVKYLYKRVYQVFLKFTINLQYDIYKMRAKLDIGLLGYHVIITNKLVI